MELSYASGRRPRRCWATRSATTSTARSRGSETARRSCSRPPGPALHLRAVRRGGRSRARARSWRPGSSRASASGSGARTAPSGRSSSTRPPRPGSSWSTSTRPTGRPSSSTCCTSPAAELLVAATAFKTSRLRADGRRGRARDCAGARAGRVPRARLGGVHRRRRAASTPTSCASARPRRSSTTRSTSSTRAARRASRRARRSATTTSSTTATSSAAGAGYTEEDRVCIPVPYYHCFGMVMGNLACTSHGACMVIPAPAFDPVATLQAVQDERCTSLYGVPTMFIAELEHPTFAEFDLSQPAHRDHGRLAVPDRDDARCVVRDAHGGGHDLLRHDRDLAGLDADRRRRPAREARRHRRAGAPARRGQDRRPRERRDRRARRAGRAVHARLQRDARLLGRAGEDRRRDRPRALDAHRRPGA